MADKNDLKKIRKEMDEWDARRQSRGLRDQRHIHGFLNRTGGHQGKAGRPRGHHV